MASHTYVPSSQQHQDTATMLADVYSIIKKCEQEEDAASQEFESLILRNAPSLQHHLEQLYDVKYVIIITRLLDQYLTLLEIYT